MFLRKRVIKTAVVLVAAVLSTLAVYGALVVGLGTQQPLMMVGSNSMEPAIGAGDMIAVASARPSEIHVGSVIIYQKTLVNIRIVHRVVCIVTSSSSECATPWYAFVRCFVSPCYYT